MIGGITKVGIDLSTTNIGVAIILPNNKVFFSEYKLLKYCDENLLENINKLEEIVLNIYHKINTQGNVVIGIELANFKNPLITQRFSEYCGILEAFLYLKFYIKTNIMIKKFNSQQWQSKIGCKNNEQRADRKERAKWWVWENYQILNDSNDITDAICIAHFVNKLETFQEKKAHVRKNIKVVAGNKAKKLQLAKSINIRQNKIINLDPIKNKQQIATLKNKIEEFQKEMEKL